MHISISVLNVVCLAGWLVCGIYTTIPVFWMMVHPFVERWRAARVKFKWLAAWWMALWVVAWAVTWPWSLTPLYSTPWLWLATPLFWAGSWTLYSKGGSGLSLRRIIGHHEVVPQSEPDQLVATGIYARVRHPIYLGHICTMLGWSLATSTIACWAMTAFYFVTLLIMLPMEEKELRQRFGPAYDEYRKKVPKLVPRLF